MTYKNKESNCEPSILNLIHSFDFGGIERLVLQLCRYSEKQNINFDVAVTDGRENKLSSDFNSVNCKIFDLGFSSGKNFSLRKVISMIKIFKKYDVIHFHYFNPFSALAAILSGKRIVYTEHGNFGFGRELNFLDGIKKYLKGHFISHRVHTTIFNSQFTKQYFISDFKFEPKNSVVVLNGIEFIVPSTSYNTFKNHYRSNESEIWIGTISRFVGFKRIDRVVDTFHKLLQHQNNIRLVIVGDGPHKQKIIDQINYLGITNKVLMPGYTNEPHNWLASFDICIFGSKNEPFGLVGVEALSLGKPVIVFQNGGGLIEIVSGICPEDVVTDIEHASKRITEYLLTEINSKEISMAREKYAHNFSISIMWNSLLTVYRGCF